MALAVDLHSHSSYAGGVGRINLQSIAQTMQSKGIDVFGVGDCLFASWQDEYKQQLEELTTGLYRLKDTKAYFIRQTEVIFTVSLPQYKQRIIAHHIILFPDDQAISKTTKLLKSYGCKNTIARPFITCKEQQELQNRLFEIQAIDPLIEIIPAHVLTPDGILGSKNALSSWKEFYGEFEINIHAVETGLSADPEMLCKIPDLKGKTFISNSDCHSAALNRVGREFTILDCSEPSYQTLINSIRKNQVLLTAEFMPSEGRYFLTGHRGDKHENKQAVFFDTAEPDNYLCPICGKKMHQGVKGRALQLSDSSLPNKHKPFMHLIPLVEVLAYSLSLKNISSKQVFDMYQTCLSAFETEINLWKSSVKDIHELLDNKLPEEIIKHIIAVRDGNFIFNPAGYDGCYGNLQIKLEKSNEQ